MIPQVVVFDLGKVLLDFDYAVAGQRVAARGKLSSAETRRVLAQSPLIVDYETGRKSTEEFLCEAVVLTGFTGDPGEFAEAFSDIFTPIPVLIETHARLQKCGVPTFLFSNTNPLAVDHVRRIFPFYQNFHGHVLSYEHGAMKPDPALYAVVERTTGRQGAEILYIDDRPENVEAGRARGWQVILQEQPERTRDAIESSLRWG